MPEPTPSTLRRLRLLGLAAMPVFAGLAAPFVLPGARGSVLALVLVGLGALSIRLVEHENRSALAADTRPNRGLGAEGEIVLGPD